MTFPLPDHERSSAIKALGEYEKLLLGLAEFAKVCGVSKQCASNWRARGHAPPADKELGMGPVWKKETIESWLTNGVPR